ncbi:helix-turn-helix domain-containing protein [Enterococcus cecorum]|nr:helix-turn-helix domain-containing protein [Enterococcus cecorum]
MNLIDAIKPFEILSVINNHDYTSYDIADKTGISQPTISRLRNGKAKFERLSLEYSMWLQLYYDYKKDSKFKLIAWEEGKLQSVENFNTFKDLKEHLSNTNYVVGFVDIKWDSFDDAETPNDIKKILEKYDIGWWKLELIEYV